MKRDIYILASDSFQGRESGTIGDSLASSYIISQFHEIGLQPKGSDNGSYLQRVPYETSFHSWDENFLTTDYDVYRYRQDFGMTSFSANGKAEGDLMVVGYTISDSLFRKGNQEENELTGKVLLMQFPLPEEFASDTAMIPKFSIRNRLIKAFQHGASAVLLWDSDSPDYADLFDFDHPDPMTGPVIFITEPVSRELKRIEGQPVRLGTGITRIHKTYHNIIGWIDHHAPKTVILGAHYDHEGINRAGSVRCGADDNASGVALILELARYLKSSGDSSFNFLFVAFGAEELGMIGSDFFCRNPVIPLEEVAYMCNFDMVGRLGAEGNRVTLLGTETSRQWKGIYQEMPKFPFRIKKYKGASNFSDQECFYEKQIPVFYLTTGMHPDYHTHFDRPERINYTGMIPIVRFAETFITRSGLIDGIQFQEVSGWSTFFPDLNYFIRQIGHLFDMPLQDWP